MKKTLLSMAFAFAALATGGLNAAEVTDVLTTDGFGITGSGYKNFSGKSFTSEAVYAGNAMRATKNGNTGYAGGGIQLRNKDNAGIVTTTSGGSIVKVAMHFDYPNGSDSEKGRTVTIYGSNTPYNSSADLYNDNNKGVVLGTLSSGVEDGEITVNGNYAYVGIHADGAVYLREISITWENSVEELVAPGFSGVAEGASYWDEATVEIACATEGATINYTVTKDDVADEPVTGAASPVSVKLTEPGRYTVTATASKDSETSEEASISFTIAAFPYDRLDPNGEIKEGTYMIVAADETGQYYMMKNAVQSNFYVQATEFDFEAGVPTTDETCLFFVEKADGGYYIKNFDQTYVSLVETMGADNKMHTNLKPAEATPFVWTFSGTKDAVVATGTEITVPMGFQMYNTTPEFAAGNDYTKPMFFYVNNETSGVESTMAGGVAVAGVDGAIAVAADEAVSVAVYTAAGQLAVSTEVAAGTTELSVAPGFYIVKAGDVVKKVIVK